MLKKREIGNGKGGHKIKQEKTAILGNEKDMAWRRKEKGKGARQGML